MPRRKSPRSVDDVERELRACAIQRRWAMLHLDEHLATVVLETVAADIDRLLDELSRCR